MHLWKYIVYSHDRQIKKKQVNLPCWHLTASDLTNASLWSEDIKMKQKNSGLYII